MKGIWQTDYLGDARTLYVRLWRNGAAFTQLCF